MSGQYRAAFSVICGFLLLQLNPGRLKAQQPDAAVSSPIYFSPFTISDRGGISISTSGTGSSVGVGSIRIQPSTGKTAPTGVAIFGFRQNGVLISEAGVPATVPMQSGRIYAEVTGSINTGVAMTNPSLQPATITFYFTDQQGRDFGAGTTTLAGGSQMAAFLDQAPFNGGSDLRGTFTYTSTVPIGVIALRGLTNQRGEFLLTTLPVASLPLDSHARTGAMSSIPQFADGGGWTTQIVLVNPSDNSISGTVRFFGQGNSTTSGQPATITINAQTASAFTYNIPARSSVRMTTSGEGANVVVGSVRIEAVSSDVLPLGIGIFSFTNGGVTVAEAGVASSGSSQSFRLYAETSTPANGSIQTGIAIANSIPDKITVNFEATTLDGTATGVSGSATVPGNGQIALFLNQLPGFESLPAPFQGVLRITTSSVGMNVVGLRGRYNERGDFLITTTPAVTETSPPNSSSVFPHIADGGGYTTQLVLFSGSSNQTTSGSLQFFSQSGEPMSLRITPVTASTPENTLSCVGEGLRLTSADIGLPGAFADSSALRLADGRWRLFYFAGQAVRSSVSGDGLSFTPEAGARIDGGGLGMPRVLRLSDGRVRIFGHGGTGVASYISSDDGFTFSVESGARVTNAAAGFSALSGPGVVLAPDGRWRMYFSDLPLPGTFESHKILSASSTDMLNWNVDPGVRFGAGAILSGSAEHPAAIANSDGTINVFYFRARTDAGNPQGLWTAKSADGLSFSAETFLGIALGNDPDVVQLPDGNLRLYYDWGDDNAGNIYSSKCTRQ